MEKLVQRGGKGSAVRGELTSKVSGSGGEGYWHGGMA